MDNLYTYAESVNSQITLGRDYPDEILGSFLYNLLQYFIF